ncbi:Fc.00g005140.m01.CDS01 [Cosmosporella sp. VM-42]
MVATFFIVGNNDGKGHIDDESTDWPKVLRRMHAAGHQLASHSWTHQDLTLASGEIRHEQVIYNEMAFRNIFGWFPKYFRPPYGSCTSESGCLNYLNQLGYHVVNYDIDTKDYEHNSPSEIQISKNTFSDAVSMDSESHHYIELSHDIHEQTAYNLTQFMIDIVNKRGYKAVTVGDCLGDPPENWYVDADGASGRSSPESPSPTKSTLPKSSPKPPSKAPPSQSSSSKSSTSIPVSTDGTCGNKVDGRYTCKGSEYGDCCSAFGYCGRTSAHCSVGCQPEFSICNARTAVPIVSDNGLCGDEYDQTCLGSEYGECCSKYGNWQVHHDIDLIPST